MVYGVWERESLGAAGFEEMRRRGTTIIPALPRYNEPGVETIIPGVGIGAGATFNGIATLPAGEETGGLDGLDYGVQAPAPARQTPAIAGPGEIIGTPTFALPAILGGALTVGAIKAMLAQWGPTILKAILGAGIFAGFLKLLGVGASDDTVVPGKIGEKGRAKRYSIGTNPRLNTLLKVGKRVDNIFVAYDKRISKFRSRLRGISPQRRRTKVWTQPYNPYLSQVERKQIAAARR